MDSKSESAERFKKALSQFASGVTIVTYPNSEFGSGITVSAFSSVSLDPPLVLVCLNSNSPAVPSIDSSRNFSIHFLKEGQEALSNTFAKPDDSRLEYLKALPQSADPGSAPKLPDVLARLDCKLHNSVEAGDHWIFIGEVEFTDILESGESPSPLLYFNRSYRKLKDL